MILLCFIFILSGLALIIAGVLLMTLHTAKTGTWSGIRPAHWDTRAKKLITITGAGILLTFIGVLAGYGI
jgi:hypothetical protein